MTVLSTGRHAGASVDVGSSSVHLLVAALTEDGLETLADESEFLGLGEAITQRHHLGMAARTGLVDTLARYVAMARALGAADVTIVGTEPIRRAGDGIAVVAAVEKETGVPLHVISHEEEAFLTAIGVTGGRAVERETVVIDIGGGSSEFCQLSPGRSPIAMGLRLGADRLTRDHARHDPPTTGERRAMSDRARDVVSRLPEGHPGEIIAVGGTVSNLLKVVRGGVKEGPLSLVDAAAALELLEDDPAATAAERFGIKPMRARILPAGALIVQAILRRFESDSLRVSDAGMREGAILATQHAGRAWRDRLGELATGWRD